MTSMLYTVAMNTKPPVPDELIMFDRQFSWRTAWKVARWWLMAFLISALCDLIFSEEKKHWSFEWRTAIVFAEFLCIALFCHDAVKWVRGMDELQRQLSLTIFIFAVSATLLFFLFWQCLDRERFFYQVFGLSPDGTISWGICSVAHACVLSGGFYGLGFLIFKRRYK